MFGVPAARIIRCRVISRRMRLGARVSVILDESILEGGESESERESENERERERSVKADRGCL